MCETEREGDKFECWTEKLPTFKLLILVSIN